jgi:predicted acylesterase/phospholipase RssA
MHRILKSLSCFFIAVLVLSGYAAARPVTVVLSGGGARGIAQIGVLKALDNAGIRPRLVVATSMGAIIGSLYAAGYCPDSIAAFARHVDWDHIFANSVKRNNQLVSQKNEAVKYLIELRLDRDFNIVFPNSISFGQSFYDYLIPRLGPMQYRATTSFDSLPTPLRIITTDILTGRCVILSKGNLVSSVRASCGLPLAFSPVDFDTMLLMDGGITGNIPVEPALSVHPDDYIIAVDVTSSLWDKEDLNNPVRLVDQIISIGIGKQKSVEKHLASIVITPDLGDFQNTDYSKIDSLINLGYEAASKVIDKIKSDLDASEPTAPANAPVAEAIKAPIRCTGIAATLARPLELCFDSVASNEALSSARLCAVAHGFFGSHGLPFARIVSIVRHDNGAGVAIDPGIVKSVEFTGNALTSRAVLSSAIPIKQGDTLKTNSAALAISALYATELFKNVNLQFDSSGAVRIAVDEKEFWRVRIGGRFDEYHLLEGFFQPAYTNVLGWGASALMHLQYGPRREKYAIEFLENLPFSSFFANKLQLEAYDSRENIVTTNETAVDTTQSEFATSISEQSLQRAGLLLLAGAQMGKSVLVDGGIRIERFRHYSSSEQSLLRDPFNNFEQGMQYLMLRTTIDDLDKFPFPENGQKHYISIGGAHDILGGSAHFMKFEASASRYFTWNKIHTFFPQVQLVWASDTLPDAERAYIGGAVPEEKYKEIGVYDYLSFFGMSPRALSGDVALLVHGNYRLKLRKSLFLTCSLDWGYAWAWDKKWAIDGGSLANLKTAYREFTAQAPVGIGIGIAYDWLIGPIRIAWGRLLENHFPAEMNIPTENQFYFSIGHDF